MSFQVRAVNAQGESEPLVGVDRCVLRQYTKISASEWISIISLFPLSFITENPFQCPGAPGKPELKDWDSDHFDMRWQEQEQEQERLFLWQ